MTEQEKALCYFETKIEINQKIGFEGEENEIGKSSNKSLTKGNINTSYRRKCFKEMSYLWL